MSLQNCRLSGLPLLDPLEETANLQRLGRPVPRELARCNALANPLGRDAARAWVLLSRASVNALNLNALQTLTIQDARAPQNMLVIPNLVVATDPVGLTAGITANDPLSAYIVELADARHRVSNALYSVPIIAAYNVRAPAFNTATVPYFYNSTNGGVAWTWATMVANIWGIMTSWLGSAPALPFSPNGTPEGFTFLGVPAWDALCEVLHRIQCAVRWNPTAGTYSIVRLGVDDPAFDAALSTALAQGRKIADAEFQNAIRCEIPFGVTVLFHAIDLAAGAEETITSTSTAWQSRTPYTVQVAGGIAGAEPGVYHPIWDDMPAIYNYAGALQNTAALATRAAERAADYFRRVGSLSKKYRQVFSGLCNIVPGGICTGVAWRQDAEGAWITEVNRSQHLGLRLDGPDLWYGEKRDSTSLQPPAFGPTYPVAFQPVQVLMITGSGPVLPDAYGHYAATLQKPEGNYPLTFATKDSVLAMELNGAPFLVGGGLFTGRLVDYNNGYPVFAINAAAGAGGGGGGGATDFWLIAVNTTVAADIPYIGGTTPQNVTPASMNGIFAGVNLLIDDAGTPETVEVISVTGTTFRAIFLGSHTGPGIMVQAASTDIPGGVVDGYAAGVYLTAQPADSYAFVANGWLMDLQGGASLDPLSIEPGWVYRAALVGADSNGVAVYADFSLPMPAAGITAELENSVFGSIGGTRRININYGGPDYGTTGPIDIIWTCSVSSGIASYQAYGIPGTGYNFSGSFATGDGGTCSVSHGLITGVT